MSTRSARKTLYRAAQHEAGHAVAALYFRLPLVRVWIDDAGGGATQYSRRLGPGEVDWTIATFAGIEAEIAAFGDAPITPGDLRAIENMIERLGLHWTEGHLDRFRQRARMLVREERRVIATLAEALIERRSLTGDDVGALLSAVRTPRALWVVA